MKIDSSLIRHHMKRSPNFVACDDESCATFSLLVEPEESLLVGRKGTGDRPFSLAVEPETVRPGRRGPATGSIWVVLGKEPFPLVGWNDFVVVIMEALTSAVQRIVVGASQSEVVHFMEGPYELRLERSGTGFLQISAVERGRGERLTLLASEVEILEAVLAPAESILDACRSRACWSTEADSLEAARAVLALALTSRGRHAEAAGKRRSSSV